MSTAIHTLALSSSVDVRSEDHGVRALRCWVCTGKGFLKISGREEECESCDGFGWLQSANAVGSQNVSIAEKSANIKEI